MKYIFIILSGLFFFTQVLSDDVTIEMLNKLGKERMIFSEKIVNVNAGDTVFWKATDKGHNVEFIKNGTPEGVEKFKSKLSEDTKYKFETPGIYAYWCTPHKALGMIGFVIVGDDKSNLDMIKKIRFFGQSKKLAQALIDQI
mgnify:FL=1|jgi:pseudoazurin